MTNAFSDLRSRMSLKSRARAEARASAMLDQIIFQVDADKFKHFTDLLDGPSRTNEAQLTAAMTRLDHIWEQLFPAEQQRIVRMMLEKVIVNSDSLDVRLRASGLHKLVLELELGEQ